ncbi:hypothetical protein QFC22_001442 [Naganishia vaughanmartiniae]|uniref:Uncharacterized protein n=1 Tax=Naganishia vaughanmartiniae TaxID=1424756 RepID=A0ACC2XHZ0_9TREE|nr:hypothetical protein QFC22_001442 [Naganishia vaughanmartiniae]
MPPPPQTMGDGGIWQKVGYPTTVKMGALMGSGVGLTIGFIFGSFSILRQTAYPWIRGGPGPRGALATLSQYMLSSGTFNLKSSAIPILTSIISTAATFGFFMSIGSVIRTDSPYTLTGGYSPTLVAAATSGSTYSAILAQRVRKTQQVEVEVMPLKNGAERWL